MPAAHAGKVAPRHRGDNPARCCGQAAGLTSGSPSGRLVVYLGPLVMIPQARTHAPINAMTYLLIRHRVADFATWKPVYDAHAPARAAAGLTDVDLLREL